MSSMVVRLMMRVNKKAVIAVRLQYERHTAKSHYYNVQFVDKKNVASTGEMPIVTMWHCYSHAQFECPALSSFQQCQLCCRARCF